jgi:DNA modification methylase
MTTALNGICPYFTMFPLTFPQKVLKRHSSSGDVVLDPFAGRGTTLYAARLLGLGAYGIDSNPVAVAISEA